MDRRKLRSKHSFFLLIPLLIIIVGQWVISARSDSLTYIGNLPRINSAFNLEDNIYINSIGVNKWDRSELFIVTNEAGLVYGKNDEKLIICKWQNHQISAPEDHATNLQIVDTNGSLIYESKLTKSVKITSCKDGLLYLQDNYPNSPNRKYTMGWDDHKRHVSNFNKGGDGKLKENISALLSEEIGLIITTGTLKFYNLDEDKTLVQDGSNNIWLYETNRSGARAK